MNNRKESRKSCTILKQDGVKMVLTKFNVNDLVDYTKVDTFDSQNSLEGYQRPLNTKHVNDIYEYFKVEDYSILPTSIILAANSEEEIKLNEKDGTIELNEAIRVIDGQHRIAALKKYVEDFRENDIPTDEEKDQFSKFVEWEYPVNIMILNKDKVIDRYIEIRFFVDINKKGKTVSTDLADSIMKNIRREFPELYVKDAVHQICLLITEKLITDESSTWYNSIKEGDIYTENKLIGVSSFKLSIISIVRMYLYEKEGKKDTYSMKIIEKTADDLHKKFRDYWIEIGDKWESSFYWESDFSAYRIDTDYNIQKTLGVMSLHKLLQHYYMQIKNFDIALKTAIDIIQKTKITDDYWIIGGEFSSYTSASGHNKIKNIIIDNATE